jgi:hypothetical protein
MATAAETKRKEQGDAAKAEANAERDEARQEEIDEETKLAEQRDEDKDHSNAPRPGAGVSDPSIGVLDTVTGADGIERVTVQGIQDGWQPAPVEPDPLLVARGEKLAKAREDKIQARQEETEKVTKDNARDKG